MEPALARLLVGETGRRAIAAATSHPDPDSFAAGVALRRDFPPDLAAAALTQVTLRRRAVTKFGDAAEHLLLTTDGLQQASRPAVSVHRAARFAAAGVRRLVDLGCGLGSDALAFAAAGIEVVAVESDPTTAILATANAASVDHGARVEVRTGTAEALAPALLTDPATAVFCDPARRDDRGRVWRVEQFSPGWDVVTGLLDGSRPACVKLGPALPHALIPAGVEAEWVSHHGDVVEVALWAGPARATGASAGHGGSRTATLLPSGHRLTRSGAAGPPARGIARPIGAYLHEPDGAAIRAGLVGTVAELTGTWLVDPQIAYLSGDEVVDSPWLTSFAVTGVLPFTEKVLRRWVSEHDVGRLEIKKRGVDLDPAALRRRLRPSGSAEATLIITRTPDGTRVVTAQRLPAVAVPAADHAGGHGMP